MGVVYESGIGHNAHGDEISNALRIRATEKFHKSSPRGTFGSSYRLGLKDHARNELKQTMDFISNGENLRKFYGFSRHSHRNMKHLKSSWALRFVHEILNVHALKLSVQITK